MIKGKQKFRTELYTIDKKKGYRIIVNGVETSRTTADNNNNYKPRNANITPGEAKAAVKVQDAPKQQKLGKSLKGC